MRNAEQQPESETPTQPWFRYGMVWMIILLPLAAVIASLVTVAIAHKHAPTILPSKASPASETIIERPEQP